MPALRKQIKKDKTKQLKLTKAEFEHIERVLKAKKVTFATFVLNAFGLSNENN